MHKPLIVLFLSVMFLGSAALVPDAARAEEQAAQKAVLVTVHFISCKCT